MQQILIALPAFVLAIGLLVVVHEAGHYAAARGFGVKVLRFAFGFGRPLWVWRRGVDQTEWAVCLVPLGGYVKMLDEAEAPVAASDRARAFNQQALWKRTVIVLAGPAANLLLAVAVFAWLGWQGVADYRPLLDAPRADSAAERAGVRAGDLVQSVNGHPIAAFSELGMAVVAAALEGRFLVLNLIGGDGAERQVRIEISAEAAYNPDQNLLRDLGLTLAPLRIPARVGEIKADSPGAAAGLRVGDRILAIDGVSVSDWRDFAAQVAAAPERRLQVKIEREGYETVLELRPERVERDGKVRGRVGIGAAEGFDSERMIVVRYGALEAVGYGVRQTWDASVLTLRVIGRMLSGAVSPKNISGPVTIADYAGRSARLGMDAYLRFLAFVSVSLGVLNLLPIPILDGGHLLYYLIEATRGRALSERALAIGQQFGLAILALLMMFAFYNDFARLFSG